MKELLLYINKNKQKFNLPIEKDFVLELHSPLRNSRTGRCMFKVRSTDSSNYHIVIQDSFSLNGIPCIQNPYNPQFSSLVNCFLPHQRGQFNCYRNTYFWSNHLNGYSIQKIISRSINDNATWQLAFTFAKLLRENQEKHSFNSSDSICELFELNQKKIGDLSLFALFKNATKSIVKTLSSHFSTICSWSHGDLWLFDVIMTNDNEIRVIDWEWALKNAPIGSDLVDLYVTTATHILNLSEEQAWMNIFLNQINQLKPLREEIYSLWHTVGFDYDNCKNVVLYSLIRSAGRVLAQDGYEGLSFVNIYLNVSLKIHNGELTFTNTDHINLIEHPRKSYQLKAQDNLSKHHYKSSIESVQTVHDDTSSAFNLKAEQKIKIGNFQEYKNKLLEILRQSPDHIDAINNLGVLEFYEGNLNSAKEFFKNALILDPYNKTAEENLLYIQNNSNSKRVNKIK